MKTSVVMNRQMGLFNVEQRTKDGMFNATSLIRQWNEVGGRKKDLDDFLSNANTKEFIKALSEDIIENQQLPNPQKNRELEILENKNVMDSLIKTAKGRYGGTWFHPYLFFKFAMWLNPKFELEVIRFMSDSLIELRNIAGDKYKTLTTAASVFPDVDYPEIALALNFIVFNRHYEGIRQNATAEQLYELKDLEDKLAYNISMGDIRTFPALMDRMRKLYSMKYRKF